MVKVEKINYFAKVAVPATLLFIFYPSWYGFAEQETLNAPASNEVDLTFAPQVNAPIRIQLKAKSEASYDRIYLETIANCSGDNLVCDELASIDVGQSPLPGQFAVLKSSLLKEILSKEYPSHSFQIEGADQVQIIAEEVIVDELKIQDILRKQLATNLAGIDGLRVKVIRAHISPQLKVRPGDYHIEFPKLSEAVGNNLVWVLKNLSGNQNLRAIYVPESGQGTKKEFWVRTEVEIEQYIPVASIPLQRGTIVSKTQFEYHWYKLSQSEKMYVTEIENVSGMKLKLSKAIGQPIAFEHVEIPKIVQRGQFLNLMVRYGDLTVTGKVKAMAEGGTGETIAVFYPATKKTFDATIIDKQTVQVLF